MLFGNLYSVNLPTQIGKAPNSLMLLTTTILQRWELK